MDQGIGRLLGRLDEKGLTENTLVIFSADNGMNMGRHGIWGNGTRPMKVRFVRQGAVPDIVPPAYPERERMRLDDQRL